jgi:hypothetical protein
MVRARRERGAGDTADVGDTAGAGDAADAGAYYGGSTGRGKCLPREDAGRGGSGEGWKGWGKGWRREEELCSGRRGVLVIGIGG